MDTEQDNSSYSQRSWRVTWLDNVTFDVMTAGWPLHLTMIGKLPKEMLIEISKQLTNETLSYLSRVCQTFRGISEPLLYSSIFFYTHSKKSITLFYRTLLDRPELAIFVKSLSLSLEIYDIQLELPVNPTFLRQSNTFIQTVDVKIPQPCLVGFILHLLPSLRYLSIVSRGNGELTSRLFGPRFNVETANLALVPGICSLENLNIDCSEFHWAIIQFPTLKSLVLYNSRGIYNINMQYDWNTITKLSIERSPSALISNHEDQEQLSSFLGNFRCLKEVQISIKEPSGRSIQIDSDEEGDYSTLVSLLSHSSQFLETIGLGFEDLQGTKWLDHLMPLGTLKDFTSLKVLQVPYEALIDKIEDMYVYTSTPWHKLLPESIETLEIWFPTLEVYDRLLHFLRFRNLLPHLSTIKLHCSSDRGDEYEEFAFRAHVHPVVRSLRDANVNIKFFHRAQDMKSVWSDLDYDFCVLDVAKFIAE